MMGADEFAWRQQQVKPKSSGGAWWVWLIVVGVLLHFILTPMVFFAATGTGLSLSMANMLKNDVENPVNTTKLEKLIEDAETIDRSRCTKASIDSLDGSLNIARSSLETTFPSHMAVNLSYDALKLSFDGLELDADRVPMKSSFDENSNTFSGKYGSFIIHKTEWLVESRSTPVVRVHFTLVNYSESGRRAAAVYEDLVKNVTQVDKSEASSLLRLSGQTEEPSVEGGRKVDPSTVYLNQFENVSGYYEYQLEDLDAPVTFEFQDEALDSVVHELLVEPQE
jgi:hypothetical protein